jgi:hypothetical protein
VSYRSLRRLSFLLCPSAGGNAPERLASCVNGLIFHVRSAFPNPKPACKLKSSTGLCKTANNGLHAKANSCACSTCPDSEFGNDDKAKAQSKEFAFACKIAMTPLDQAVIDAAYAAATCPGTDAPSPPSPGYGYGPAPPPAAPTPPGGAPGNGYGPPPPPGSLPPPPKGWPLFFSASVTHPISFSCNAKANASEPGTHSSPLTSPYISVTVPTSLFKPSSPPGFHTTKSTSVGGGYSNVGGAGAYDSTQIIQSTVMISPVPVVSPLTPPPSLPLNSSTNPSNNP